MFSRGLTKMSSLGCSKLAFEQGGSGFEDSHRVVHVQTGAISYYDSLNLGEKEECMQKLREYFNFEAKQRGVDVKRLTWTNSTPEDIPKQLNGRDCRIFACAFAEHIARDASINFSQEDINECRKEDASGNQRNKNVLIVFVVAVINVVVEV